MKGWWQPREEDRHRACGEEETVDTKKDVRHGDGRGEMKQRQEKKRGI